MAILKTLGWTIMIESAVLLTWMRLSSEKTDMRLVLYEILINTVTNPLLHIAILILRIRSMAPVLLLELLVIGIEALMYRAMTTFSLRKCLTLSVLLNTASYCIGLIIM